MCICRFLHWYWCLWLILCLCDYFVNDCPTKDACIHTRRIDLKGYILLRQSFTQWETNTLALFWMSPTRRIPSNLSPKLQFAQSSWLGDALQFNLDTPHKGNPHLGAALNFDLYQTIHHTSIWIALFHILCTH